MKETNFTLKQIVDDIGGELRGDQHSANLSVDSIAPLDSATQNQISFYTSPSYAKLIPGSKAGAIITGKFLENCKSAQIIHDEPYVAMAKLSCKFHKWEPSYKGVSENAHIDPLAVIAPGVVIYPNVYVEAGAKIATGSVLYPNVYVGRNVLIGESCTLFPSVTVMDDTVIGDRCVIHGNCVLGADGFGFAPGKNGNEKIAQVAKVVVGNDVEIQSCSVVDRGALEDTVIADGCKLDSHVLVAHGVEVGKHGLICGGSSIAGSAKIGSRLTMAGHAAIAPGIKVGNNITLGGKAGLTGNLDKPGSYHDMPVSATKDWRRQKIALRQLPELLKTVRALEARLAVIEGRGTDLSTKNT